MTHAKPTHFPSLRRGGIQPALGWAFVIIILGGLMIGWNYYIKEQVRGSDKVPRAYNLGRQNLELVDQDGEKISLFEIGEEDKPWMLSTFYTHCPMQCAGVAEELLRMDKKLGEGRVNFVLISFDPERDRPENLRSWAQAHGLTGDNWYLLTAPEGMSEEIIFDYLEEPLKMARPKWRLGEDGERDHSQEPEHPMNVLALTGNDMRDSFTIGVVPSITTPAMVRQSVERMEETVTKLLAETEK